MSIKKLWTSKCEQDVEQKILGLNIASKITLTAKPKKISDCAIMNDWMLRFYWE